MQKQRDKLKLKAEETFKIKDLSGDLLAENFEREIKNFKLKVCLSRPEPRSNLIIPDIDPHGQAHRLVAVCKGRSHPREGLLLFWRHDPPFLRPHVWNAPRVRVILYHSCLRRRAYTPDGCTSHTPSWARISSLFATSNTAGERGTISCSIYVTMLPSSTSFISGSSLPTLLSLSHATASRTVHLPMLLSHGETVSSSMTRTKLLLCSYTSMHPLPLPSLGKFHSSLTFVPLIHERVFRHFYPGSSQRFPALIQTPYLDPLRALVLSGGICASPFNDTLRSSIDTSSDCSWQLLYWKFLLVDRRAKIDSGQRTTSFSYLLHDKGFIGKNLSLIPAKYREAIFIGGQLCESIAQCW